MAGIQCATCEFCAPSLAALISHLSEQHLQNYTPVQPSWDTVPISLGKLQCDLIELNAVTEEITYTADCSREQQLWSLLHQSLSLGPDSGGKVLRCSKDGCKRQTPSLHLLAKHIAHHLAYFNARCTSCGDQLTALTIGQHAAARHAATQSIKVELYASQSMEKQYTHVLDGALTGNMTNKDSTGPNWQLAHVTAAAELSGLKGRFDTAVAKLNSLKTQYNSLVRDFNQKKSEVAKLRAMDSSELQKQLEDSQKNVRELQQKNVQLTDDLCKCEERKSTLEAVVDRLETELSEAKEMVEELRKKATYPQTIIAQTAVEVDESNIHCSTPEKGIEPEQLLPTSTPATTPSKVPEHHSTADRHVSVEAGCQDHIASDSEGSVGTTKKATVDDVSGQVEDMQCVSTGDETLQQPSTAHSSKPNSRLDTGGSKISATRRNRTRAASTSSGSSSGSSSSSSSSEDSKHSRHRKRSSRRDSRRHSGRQHATHRDRGSERRGSKSRSRRSRGSKSHSRRSHGGKKSSSQKSSSKQCDSKQLVSTLRRDTVPVAEKKEERRVCCSCKQSHQASPCPFCALCRQPHWWRKCDRLREGAYRLASVSEFRTLMEIRHGLEKVAEAIKNPICNVCNSEGHCWNNCSIRIAKEWTIGAEALCGRCEFCLLSKSRTQQSPMVTYTHVPDSL